MRSELVVASLDRVAAVCALAAAFLVSGAVASHGGPGVKTAKPPYLVPTAAGVEVDPILSTGDIVPTGQTPQYQMSGIPDGLGAYANKNSGDGADKGRGQLPETFTVVMNHELGRSFPNNPPGVDTRISRLRIDRETHSVHVAKYLFIGLEGYERFCSSTLRIVGGSRSTSRGRVYQLDISRSDPTSATLKMILNGDAPDNDDIYNPGQHGCV